MTGFFNKIHLNIHQKMPMMAMFCYHIDDDPWFALSDNYIRDIREFVASTLKEDCAILGK